MRRRRRVLSVVTHTQSTDVFPSMPGARRAQMPPLKPVAANRCVCIRSCFPAVHMSLYMPSRPMPEGTHKPCSAARFGRPSTRPRCLCVSCVAGRRWPWTHTLARRVPSPRCPLPAVLLSCTYVPLMQSTLGCAQAGPAPSIYKRQGRNSDLTIATTGNAKKSIVSTGNERTDEKGVTLHEYYHTSKLQSDGTGRELVSLCGGARFPLYVFKCI